MKLRIAVFVLLVLLGPVVASAQVVFSPTSPQASGWLAISGVLATHTGTYYPEVVAADGTTCFFPFAATDADTWQIGVTGQFGGSNWAAYAPTQCTGGSPPDWSVDGDYVVNFYADSGRVTLIDTATFHQGAGPTPPPYQYGGATSTLEQAQSNLYNAFVLFFLSMFGMIWLIRKH